MTRANPANAKKQMEKEASARAPACSVVGLIRWTYTAVLNLLRHFKSKY